MKTKTDVLVLIEQNDMHEAITLDHHFIQAGYTRLPSQSWS